MGGEEDTNSSEAVSPENVETLKVLLYRAGQKGIGLVAANKLRLVAALFDQQTLEITLREQMERRYL